MNMGIIMKNVKYISYSLLLLLAGCASMPNGPSQMAMPGTGKDFDQFRADDSACRYYAHDQIGGKTANDAANESFVESAAVGTAIGALIGAAAGGRNGAGVGAATGLAFGSVAGVSASEVTAYNAQQRYDNAYIQCMYSKGHRVPVSGNFVPSGRSIQVTPTINRYVPPPPPPGYSNHPPEGYLPPPPPPTQ